MSCFIRLSCFVFRCCFLAPGNYRDSSSSALVVLVFLWCILLSMASAAWLLDLEDSLLVVTEVEFVGWDD